MPILDVIAGDSVLLPNALLGPVGVVVVVVVVAAIAVTTPEHPTAPPLPLPIDVGVPLIEDNETGLVEESVPPKLEVEDVAGPMMVANGCGDHLVWR